ncbi:acyltransferase [Actinoplanes sp. TBRC 11911]|uniref:acyltransferase family protein n=1 Tax=Actinoplanes sp. TBRC 11911 TaxID=2729386 RepID=UPI00145E7142|nr:acyltransferase [Actinoplanes sp. TBRC 11911]NMO53392.1 acyltransferase [Actinoplanes sp. TBRC 11911]
MRNSTTRLYAVDGLRLVCALAVAGYHYGVSWRLDGVHPPAYFLPYASHVLIFGFLGVEVFFLISGFVIGMSGWGRSLRQFAVARAARLYPAFWVCVPITAVVVNLLPVRTGVVETAPPSPAHVAVNLTMLAEPLGVPLVDGVYWTLWVELRFYLLFAVLVWWGATYRRVAAAATAWLTASLFAPVLPGWVAQILIPEFAPYFVAGLVLFLMRKHRPTTWLWALLIACWLISLQRVTDRVASLQPGFSVPSWPALVIITAAFVVLTAIALGATDRLNLRRLAVAGALTYPFYLLHPRVGYSLMRAAHHATGAPASVLVPVTIAVVLGASWLVHRYVERPFAPLLRSVLSGRRSSKVVPSPTEPRADTSPR